MPTDTPLKSDIPPSVELIALRRLGGFACGWEGSADDQRFIRRLASRELVLVVITFALFVLGALLTKLFRSPSSAVVSLLALLGVYVSILIQKHRERAPFRPVRIGLDGVRIGGRFIAHDEILEVNVEDACAVLKTQGRPVKLVFRDAFGSRAFADALGSRARVRVRLLEDRVTSVGYREVRVEPALESVKHALTEGTWEGSLPEDVREALVRV